MRKLTTAVLAATALLAGARPAPADQSITYPAPPNGTLTKSLDAGYRFWQTRGIQPWPRGRLVVYVAPLPERELAEATVGGGQMWIGQIEWREVTTNLPRRGDEWLTWRRVVQRAFCTVVIHELGHTAGLEHTATGVMSAGVDSAPPNECRTVFPLPPPPP